MHARYFANLFKEDEGCVDIDECLADVCQEFSTCFNQLGSYTCLCFEGYEIDESGFCKLAPTLLPTTVNSQFMLNDYESNDIEETEDEISIPSENLDPVVSTDSKNYISES